MSRAAKEILDGPNESHPPDLEQMMAHWVPVVTERSKPVTQDFPKRPCAQLELLWDPVTCEDTVAVNLPLSSAPGIDGITPRQWRAVPASIKALFFNIVLASGGFPPELLLGRTVFVPKKAVSVEPGDFRPISIASVVVRHLHKILAARLRDAGVVDFRQRCMDDGCADNIAVLASLLEDSRRRLKELHVSSLDVAKAFDSVSHDALTATLKSVGAPKGFTAYIQRLYASSFTVFEVDGSRSRPVRVSRGVRQGDPLSTILFCLVIDEVLRAVPLEVGYEMNGELVNATAYADDILLISSTAVGMSVALRQVEHTACQFGLRFNASKCVALSVVPAGKQKKYKVLSVPQFQLADGSEVRQLTASQEWRYLGVDFRPLGLKRAGRLLTDELLKLTRAPLKPQQRLKILRCFLIPRLYHVLVLAGTTLGRLRALDRQVRLALRKWLRLPHDTPIGYFHASCSHGGLGVPSLATAIPGLMFHRLSKLAQSSSPSVKAIAEAHWTLSRISWAKRALTKDGEFLCTGDQRNKWWANKLYNSLDGRELRDASGTSLSTSWVDAGSYGIPGRDYVQFHHIRINALPTRVRTSRGQRRDLGDLKCRAGCNALESAAHVVQVCHRTHGGRVKRHNAVCKVVATGLRNLGWTVHEEPHFRTSVGLRKPDLVALKDGTTQVIDAQVVSATVPLDELHERKKKYYGDNEDLKRCVISRYGVEREKLLFTSCTISWRGVWSAKSSADLLSMGLRRSMLRGITTRVLQGSHMNWTRWNKSTGVNYAIGSREGRPRLGVG